MINANTMPLEAETRILIDRTLENLGWKLDGKDKNVFTSNRDLKQNGKNLVERDRTMSCTQKRAISR